MTHNYKELRVWEESIELATEIHALTDRFPKTELFGLTSQLRRAVVSVSSNIAEGCGRGTNTDFARFLHHALGSLREIESQLTIAYRLQISDVRQTATITQRCDTIAKMLYGLIKKLKATSESMIEVKQHTSYSIE